MRYLIVIWLSVLSSFVYSQAQIFKAVPKEHIFSINVKNACKSQSGFRFCKEHSELKGTGTFFCNLKKYDCNKLDSLLTIQQYIHEESNLAENCLVTFNINQNYEKGELVRYYVTGELRQGCEI